MIVGAAANVRQGHAKASSGRLRFGEAAWHVAEPTGLKAVSPVGVTRDAKERVRLLRSALIKRSSGNVIARPPTARDPEHGPCGGKNKRYRSGGDPFGTQLKHLEQWL